MQYISLTKYGRNNMESLKQFSVKGRDLPLHQVFSLLKLECESEEAIQLASEFCFLTDSELNRRTGLEFLYAYGYLDQLELLIEKSLQSENPVTRKWGAVYKIIHEWKKEQTKPCMYLKQLEALEINEPELICLENFIHVYAYYEWQDFGKLGCHLDRLLEGIQNLQDPLLQELFSIRLDEVLMTYYWKRNEMLIARKHGYKILNRTYNECKKADIHNALALGFIYESFEQAIYHGREALRLAEKHNCGLLMEEVANYTIPFITAYYGKAEGVTSNAPSEQAYLSLANGDRQTCIRILEQLEHLTPFQQFYLGQAKASRRLLEESHFRFINERSDYFFARLPLLELNKMKVSN